jgi:hypothetical protein
VPDAVLLLLLLPQVHTMQAMVSFKPADDE